MSWTLDFSANWSSQACLCEHKGSIASNLPLSLVAALVMENSCILAGYKPKCKQCGLHRVITSLLLQYSLSWQS